MRRFLLTLSYSMGCGMMLVGSGSALLILWYILFSHLGIYFDLIEVLEMSATSLVGGVSGMMVGAVLGFVFGLLIYVTNNYRHIMEIVGYSCLALAFILGAAFASTVHYSDIALTV